MSNPPQTNPSANDQDGGAPWPAYAPYDRPGPRAMGGSPFGSVPASSFAFSASPQQLNRPSHLFNPSDRPDRLVSPYNQDDVDAWRERTLNTSYGPADTDDAVPFDYARRRAMRPRALPQAPRLPRISRIFENWAFWDENPEWFTPSYLRGTTYITKLEDAFRKNQAQKEYRQQTGAAADATPLAVGKVAASHLGMTYDLIERPPSFDHAPTVPPLPTRWNPNDKHGGLDVSPNGLEIRYAPATRNVREQEHEVCGIRADHPMPSQAGIYYFEITLLTKRKDEYRFRTSVCIGFASKNVALARPPGWEPESWGLHGDDGDLYAGGNNGKKYGDSSTFGSGDVVGCGVNFRTGQAFFTKNGTRAGKGPAFRDIKGKLYPVIGLKKTGEHVRANFGQSPFVFDINKLMKDEQDRIKETISKTSIEKLVSPPISETELIQKLVLQFLQHDGYVETAREFAKELFEEHHALRIESTAPVSGFSVNVSDDDDANRRQRIRKAVLEGDIDRALKLTNTFYPHVLEHNQQVYFKLKCRKFIEMITKAQEVNVGGKTNGHSYEDAHQKMDVDESASDDDSHEEEGEDVRADTNELLEEAVRFGQALQAEFKDDPRREVTKALNDMFGLMAYRNPLGVKEIAPLLDRKGRTNVAEELNSAILSSLGKSSRSALENLCGQTSVLLDYLREEGGAGSLINIQSVIDDIPKPQTL
ncbi:SPRY domain-containing protein [Xylariaceae sp. FL1272]|nr:SPRY domain-containing protein [Xylariaceae sp. FL1272]